MSMKNKPINFCVVFFLAFLVKSIAVLDLISIILPKTDKGVKKFSTQVTLET